MKTQINGHFTCDNCYAVYIGNAAGVTQKILPSDASNGIVNGSAGEIFEGENITFDADPTSDWFYLIAWSDDTSYQGLIGSFTGGRVVNTGNPKWEVLPTKKNAGVGKETHPSANEINNFIASAQPSDWKKPHVGPTNANTNQIYGGSTKVNNVPLDANWIWYNSGKDTSKTAPFNGFNHDEFLIFRIPCEEFTQPTPIPNPAPMPPSSDDCNCGSQSVIVNCGTNTHPPAPVTHECECGTCVYEVRVQRMRYIEGKAGGLFEGAAELSFTFHVNGNAYNYPTANGSYIKLLKRKGEYSKAWLGINTRVGIVQVPCKGGIEVDIMTEMTENPMNEKGIPAILEGGRPWGCSDPTTLKFECERKPNPIYQRVKLEHGGNRTENLVMEVEYYFSKITPDSCCSC